MSTYHTDAYHADGTAHHPSARVVRIGDDVLYRLESGHSKGQLRPAKVVRTFGPQSANLRVFLDGTNDEGAQEWPTSRVRGSEPGQWSWPDEAERSEVVYPGAPAI